MPKDITKEEAHLGSPAFQWMVREYERHERDRRWVMVTGAAGLLLIAYALLSANYLFAIIIILFAIILYLQELRTPLEIPFAITDTGIIIGKRWYSYNEINNFWIIYNPPEVKNLYISPNSLINHRIQIPLSDFDPGPIRDFLNQYIKEDLEQEEEPLSDRFGRLMKLH